MKRLLTYIFILVQPILLYGQESLILNSSTGLSGTVKACSSITLLPGFSYTAAGSNGLNLVTDISVCSPKPLNVSTSTNQNYIIKVTPINETETVDFEDGKVLIGRTLDRNAGAITSIQYYDGLGRPNQTVSAGITSEFNDLVVVQEYDGFGRQSKTWLPIVSGLSNGSYFIEGDIEPDATNWYKDSKPYSEPVYEASPLNRVLEQYGSGSAWHNNGKSVKITYMTNNESYKCNRFSIGQNGGSYFLNHGNYAKGELFVTETKDEDGKISYEFKNKLGQVVLTRQMDDNIAHSTHYIYDDFGNLCYVLPPILSDSIIDKGAQMIDTGKEVMHYAYIYKYDERNRCIKKKLPGCDWIYYVYDRADQLILSQDGEQRKENKWTFNKYDELGRLIISGEKVLDSSKNHTFLREKYKEIIVKEEYQFPNYYCYTWNTMVGDVDYTSVLLVNYYDDYSRLLQQSSAYGDNLYAETKSGFPAHYARSAKGLLTGTRRKILEDTSQEIATAFYYDEKGQIVLQKSFNHIGGVDKEFIAYNFTGQPVKQYVQHTGNFLFNITELTEDYVYTYDHAGRLKTTTRNGVVIESLSYNELGQIEGRKQGSSFDSKFSYNIRGWITQQKDQAGSKFNMDIKYQDHPLSEYKAYNGNISQTSYNYGGYPITLDYTYDQLNRLTRTNDGYFRNFEEMDYDKHGNIISIWRNSGKEQTSTTDALSISYNGNQMHHVLDEYGSSNKADVIDYPGDYSATFFSYNANGALTSDSGRGIDSIKYNSLNLPQRIKFNNGNLIEYTYSASGEKLKAKYTTTRQTVTQPLTSNSLIGGIILPPVSGLSQTRTVDYIGNIVVESNAQSLVANKLKVLFNGGYEEHWKSVIAIIGQEPKYEINTYFQLKDYLGNIRDVKKEGSSDIVQRTEYLPFGTPLKQEVGDAGAQRYKFGGKEFDQMHGLNMYDFHARQYDPLLGRFHTVDPLAEKYYSISPYVYCNNNPLRYVDPTGEFPIETIWDIGNVLYDVGAAVVNHIKGDHEAAKSNWVDLGLDAGAMLIPYVPAGASKIVKGGTASAKALDKAADGAKTMDKAVDAGKSAKTFDGGASTNSKTGNEALGKAKEANGIPRSQQPDKTIKPNTPKGNKAGLDSRNVKQYEYTNSKGEKVTIRQDKPANYSDGGSQPAHYNAGKNKKLEQHHNY